VDIALYHKLIDED